MRRKPAGQALGAIVHTVTDVDYDGYGLFGRPPDPAPFEAQVFPYAVDWPGNGVDEDGVAGDLPADTLEVGVRPTVLVVWLLALVTVPGARTTVASADAWLGGLAFALLAALLALAFALLAALLALSGALLPRGAVATLSRLDASWGLPGASRRR